MRMLKNVYFINIMNVIVKRNVNINIIVKMNKMKILKEYNCCFNIEL